MKKQMCTESPHRHPLFLSCRTQRAGPGFGTEVYLSSKHQRKPSQKIRMDIMSLVRLDRIDSATHATKNEMVPFAVT